MLPPAMPEVTEEAIPENRRARAKMMAELLPSMGRRMSAACWSWSTRMWLLKNVAAARSIMAELIAHPMIIDRMVSVNSKSSCRLMILSSRRFH